MQLTSVERLNVFPHHRLVAEGQHLKVGPCILHMMHKKAMENYMMKPARESLSKVFQSKSIGSFYTVTDLIYLFFMKRKHETEERIDVSMDEQSVNFDETLICTNRLHVRWYNSVPHVRWGEIQLLVDTKPCLTWHDTRPSPEYNIQMPYGWWNNEQQNILIGSHLNTGKNGARIPALQFYDIIYEHIKSIKDIYFKYITKFFDIIPCQISHPLEEILLHCREQSSMFAVQHIRNIATMGDDWLGFTVLRKKLRLKHIHSFREYVTACDQFAMFFVLCLDSASNAEVRCLMWKCPHDAIKESLTKAQLGYLELLGMLTNKLAILTRILSRGWVVRGKELEHIEQAAKEIIQVRKLSTQVRGPFLKEFLLKFLTFISSGHGGNYSSDMCLGICYFVNDMLNSLTYYNTLQPEDLKYFESIYHRDGWRKMVLRLHRGHKYAEELVDLGIDSFMDFFEIYNWYEGHPFNLKSVFKERKWSNTHYICPVILARGQL